MTNDGPVRTNNGLIVSIGGDGEPIGEVQSTNCMLKKFSASNFVFATDPLGEILCVICGEKIFTSRSCINK